MIKFHVKRDHVGYPRLTYNGKFPSKMTKNRAIELSIKKWECIVSFLEEHKDIQYVHGVDGDTCALCQKYADDPVCIKCPVYVETGEVQCRKSPFMNYWCTRDHDTALSAARREVKFLESLLEKYGK